MLPHRLIQTLIIDHEIKSPLHSLDKDILCNSSHRKICTKYGCPPFETFEETNLHVANFFIIMTIFSVYYFYFFQNKLIFNFCISLWFNYFSFVFFISSFLSGSTIFLFSFFLSHKIKSMIEIPESL